MCTFRLFSAAALVAAIGVAPHASAQQGSQQQSQQRQQDQQRWEQQQRQQWEQQQSRQQTQRPRLDTESVTIVGYDFNQDGQVDAWQTITRYDLEQMKRDRSLRPANRNQGQAQMRYDAQQRRWSRQPQMRHDPNSMARMHHERMRMEQDRMRWERDQRMRAQAQQMNRSTHRLSGTLEKLTSFSFANDGDEKHLVGKIRLDDGRTLPVHFGREQQLSADLQKGDRIGVIGRIGKLNDKRIVLADRVMDKRGAHSIARTNDRNTRSVRGTVESIEQVRLQDGRSSTLTRIKTDDGRKIVAACGPRTQLRNEDVRIEKGDEVALLGRMTRIDGRPVLLTTWVSHDGESARPAPSTARLKNAQQFTSVYESLHSNN